MYNIDVDAVIWTCLSYAPIPVCCSGGFCGWCLLVFHVGCCGLSWSLSVSNWHRVHVAIVVALSSLTLLLSVPPLQSL